MRGPYTRIMDRAVSAHRVTVTVLILTMTIALSNTFAMLSRGFVVSVLYPTLARRSG